MDEAVNRLEARFPGAIIEKSAFRGETSLSVKPGSVREVAQFCRDALGFDYFIDLATIDHFETEPRWEVVYELYSMGGGRHLRLKFRLPENEPEAPTVSDLWPTANWHEREAFDMMGIRFKDHPDLRRILMWEGYPHYPLRKDFPLEGLPSDVPDVAFTDAAPLQGGPFVTAPTDGTTQVREPRAHYLPPLPPKDKFVAEP
ncbi:MAG: NADH-quinone oxidoreductase subunit C [Terrimicrobiaceae bacterium]|nr:NADH-quinone oxidoreductase subunit C [Terrimicrobiaceae bacterium]